MWICGTGHATFLLLGCSALNLNGRVMNAVFRTHGVDVPQCLLRPLIDILLVVGPGTIRQKAVHTQYRHTVTDAPNVQIVHSLHRRNLRNGAVHLIPANVWRHFLQQHGHAAAHDAQGRGEDEGAKQERHHGIDQMPVGAHPNDQARHEDGHGLRQIAQDVNVGRV